MSNQYRHLDQRSGVGWMSQPAEGLYPFAVLHPAGKAQFCSTANASAGCSFRQVGLDEILSVTFQIGIKEVLLVA